MSALVDDAETRKSWMPVQGTGKSVVCEMDLHHGETEQKECKS